MRTKATQHANVRTTHDQVTTQHQMHRILSEFFELSASLGNYTVFFSAYQRAEVDFVLMRIDLAWRIAYGQGVRVARSPTAKVEQHTQGIRARMPCGLSPEYGTDYSSSKSLSCG